jgi:hypothetical protein
MKTRHLIFLSIMMGALISSCSKSKNSGVILTAATYTASLTGSNVTPPDSSKAIGIANFTFNPATMTLSGTVTYTGITPTAAHIYKGAPKTNGSEVFTLGTPPFTSPIHFNSPTLSQDQIYDLTNGSYYIELQSAAFPKGEIRGQLVKQAASGSSGTTPGTGGY